MTSSRRMILESGSIIVHLIPCFGNSNVLSEAYSEVAGCFPVVPSIAARTRIAINYRKT